MDVIAYESPPVMAGIRYARAIGCADCQAEPFYDKAASFEGDTVVPLSAALLNGSLHCLIQIGTRMMALSRTAIAKTRIRPSDET